jgi:hypothetical protein
MFSSSSLKHTKIISSSPELLMVLLINCLQ